MSVFINNKLFLMDKLQLKLEDTRGRRRERREREKKRVIERWKERDIEK